MNQKEKNRTSYKKWYYANIEFARKSKRENMRKYRADNPDKHRAQSRAAKKKLKEAVLDVYGRTCSACGFSDVRALTLDHVLNNGAEERASVGERGVYRRALKPEFRLEYQTLCMNCQFIKRVVSMVISHGNCSQTTSGVENDLLSQA